MRGEIVSILINVLCFMGGAIFGIAFLCIFIAAGKADEEAGIK